MTTEAEPLTRASDLQRPEHAEEQRRNFALGYPSHDHHVSPNNLLKVPRGRAQRHPNKSPWNNGASTLRSRTAPGTR